MKSKEKFTMHKKVSVAFMGVFNLSMTFIMSFLIAVAIKNFFLGLSILFLIVVVCVVNTIYIIDQHLKMKS